MTNHEISKSLGLISYCLTTKKWLLIQPKYSHGFQIIVLGRYLPAQLLQLITSIIPAEKNIILEFCRLAMGGLREAFDQLYQQYFLLISADYSYLRFQTRGSDIQAVLTNFECFYQQLTWRFPSGAAHHSETPLITAKREFTEETTADHHDFKIISSKPLIHEYVGTNGCTYQYHFWIQTCQYQIVLTPPSIDDPEIAARAWWSDKEALKIINAEQQKLLLAAIKYMYKNRR